MSIIEQPFEDGDNLLADDITTILTSPEELQRLIKERDELAAFKENHLSGDVEFFFDENLRSWVCSDCGQIAVCSIRLAWNGSSDPGYICGEGCGHFKCKRCETKMWTEDNTCWECGCNFCLDCGICSCCAMNKNTKRRGPGV